MTEPSTLHTVISGLSIATMSEMLRRILHLPPWRPRRITYHVPDPSEVERPDLWCCRIGDRHFLTSNKALLEQRMDLAQQRGDSIGPVGRVRWHGKVRSDVRVVVGRGSTPAEAVHEALAQLGEDCADEYQTKGERRDHVQTR